MENVTDALIALPPTAFAGIATDVVTSTSGETATLFVALSGSRLVPWLVAVLIAEAMVTAPLAGAVNATPIVNVVPAPSVVGSPVNVTTPVAGS